MIRETKVDPQRYAHIDALRAFSVMLVVVAHTNIGGVPGGSGVTIFFVISGFIITHLLIRERLRTKRFDIRGFYFRRFLKLAPPFLVVLAIPTFIYSFAHEITWDAVAAQVFFVANWFFLYASGEIHILPGSSVVWSLAIEEQFYLGFALIWLVLVRRARWRFLLFAIFGLAAVISAGLRILYVALDVDEQRIYLGTDTRFEAIALGVAAAGMYSWLTRSTGGSRLQTRLRTWLGDDLAVVLAVLAYGASLLIRDELFRDTARYTIQAGAAALVVLYGLLTPARTRFSSVFNRLASLRLIRVLGLASYSIYLAHAVVMQALEPFVHSWPEYLRAPFLVVVGTASGVLVWRLVEKPVERWKMRRARRTAPEKAPLPAAI